ncbi:MAG TPA: urease accessory protein UreD [Polyangiaceae bacterium]|nr:urease accessory protein UreD [Polyangiaceae bacterium]
MQAAELPELQRSERAGWEANLTLGFRRVGPRTVLSHREHNGPLRVQRPFYPEGPDLCHVYVLHPPGGLAGGDRLSVNVMLESDAWGLLTTPAATKFYRTLGREAVQVNTLAVAEGAACEWLPQEAIVFGGARAVSRTRVELAAAARFAGWEVTCLGRPAAGDHFESGTYTSAFEIWHDSAPLWIDRSLFSRETLAASWGSRGLPVFGTFVCAPAAPPELVQTLREEIRFEASDELFAVSSLRQVTVCRYLGRSTQRGLSCFQRAWQLLRPRLWQRPASPPRIWLT